MGYDNIPYITERRKDTMIKQSDAETVLEKLKSAVYFTILYQPKKYKGKFIKRNGMFYNKCKIGNGYIIYYDRDRGGYRCASGQSFIELQKGQSLNA